MLSKVMNCADNNSPYGHVTKRTRIPSVKHLRSRDNTERRVMTGCKSAGESKQVWLALTDASNTHTYSNIGSSVRQQ